MKRQVEALRETEGFAAQSSLPVHGHVPQAVKRLMTVRLAQFARPSEVRQEVKEAFGLDLELYRIRTYDASKASYGGGKTLRTLFEETRKAWLADYTNIGIAHMSQRLRALERMAEKAEDEGASGMAAKLLEQAAREVNGGFSNVQQVKHSGGLGIVHLTAEDAKAELAQRLNSEVQVRLALSCPVKVEGPEEA